MNQFFQWARGHWLFALVLATFAGAVAAQTPAPSCAAPEQRQFDFWVGHWDVYGAGDKKVGENIIERIAGNCALLENWSGNGSVTGKSLNIWDADDKRWHQTWVDSHGGRLELSGGLVEGRMVMSSTGFDPKRPAVTVTQRISWTPQPDGSVRQLWESTEDAGKTWAVAFDGRYVKRR